MRVTRSQVHTMVIVTGCCALGHLAPSCCIISRTDHIRYLRTSRAGAIEELAGQPAIPRALRLHLHQQLNDGAVDASVCQMNYRQ